MNGKQLHLWQVSKASQLQYYLVKILQDNAFFTQLKNAKNPVFSTFQSFANFHPVSRWELFISLQHSRTLCRHATLLPQTGVLNRLTNIDAARTQTLLTKRDPLHFDPIIDITLTQVLTCARPCFSCTEVAVSVISTDLLLSLI